MKGSYIDLLIRIKNGYMAQKESVVIPHSKMNIDVLKIIKQLGYIKDVVIDKKNKLEVEAVLSYTDGKSDFTDVSIYSKPGKKIYIKASKIKTKKVGISTKVLTTSKGIMTDLDAKKNNVGGELLFEIW